MAQRTEEYTMTTYRTDLYYRYDWRFSSFEAEHKARERTPD